jgi:hypothetical protein
MCKFRNKGGNAQLDRLYSLIRIEVLRHIDFTYSLRISSFWGFLFGGGGECSSWNVKLNSRLYLIASLRIIGAVPLFCHAL